MDMSTDQLAPGSPHRTEQDLGLQAVVHGETVVSSTAMGARAAAVSPAVKSPTPSALSEAASDGATSSSASPLPPLAEASPSGITMADYQSTGRVTRNRTRAAEGREIRKPRYNFKANAQNPNAPEKPRWYNQTYLLFLALRKAGQPLPRGKLIPMALQLDMELSHARGLPPLFGGKTPQNTASGILTENRDQLFVSFIPEGQKHVYFKLSYEPGNFNTALEAYNNWNDTLINIDWPYLFSKNRPAYEATLRRKELIVSPSRSSTPAPVPDFKPEDDLAESNPPIMPLVFDVKGEASMDLEGADLKAEPVESTSHLSSSPKRKREDDEATRDGSLTKTCKLEPSVDEREELQTGLAGAQALPLVPLDPPLEAKHVKTLKALERTKAIRLADVKDPELVFTNADDDVIPTSLRDILEVKESTIPNSGRGVFAKWFLPANTEVGFYFGIPMTEDEFDSLKGNLGVSNAYAHRYRLTVIDGTDDEGQPYPVDNPHFYCPFHFMNENPGHANMVFYAGPLVNQIICMTTKDIQPGEELFVNYGTAVERHWPGPVDSRTSSRSTPDPQKKTSGPRKAAVKGKRKKSNK
ncbi:hypothetical protein HDU87_002452 [Geranomyces variabilis]|uniref:SET domain-containing protein n=1 Tax=Geranomyces variabilis TaxID=109894 RepID=A0AAD5TLT8_9FUNG|nr:hypothetical protein HDU87_002452 [Geranomyces variabilis]